jgi:hypothetical protein
MTVSRVHHVVGDARPTPPALAADVNVGSDATGEYAGKVRMTSGRCPQRDDRTEAATPMSEEAPALRMHR